MKISVIIAYHGEEKYIKDCLTSLNIQTIEDMEVILVCSNCEKPDVTPYENLNLQFVNVEVDGVAAARNKGLEVATGDYAMFLDSDDYLEGERSLEILLEEGDGKDLIHSLKNYSWYSRNVYLDNEQKETTAEDAAENDSEALEGEDETKEEKKSDYDTTLGNLLRNARIWPRLSVLGVVFARSIYEKIRFHEEYHYYSDLPFLVEAASLSQNSYFCEERVYVKHRHNDPINDPSLSQENDKGERLLESMRAYRTAAVFVTDPDERVYFDSKFIRQYLSKILRDLINEPPKVKKALMNELVPSVALISEYTEKNIHPYRRKMVRLAKAGDLDGIIKQGKKHGRKQNMKRVVTSYSELKKYLYKKVFSKKPLDEKLVIFESFFGKNYSDSPKYIFEYMNEHYPGEYTFVWIHAGKKLKLPYAAKQVKRFTMGYFYYMAIAKYHVFNGRQPVYFIKREGNVFLETWHGTPLKKLVFDMDEVVSASPTYKSQFYRQKSCWDYLVAPNRFSEDIFRHAFMYDGKYLETGYPRNDILYCKDMDERVRKIKEKLGITLDKKVILYAPTWRDDDYYDHAKYHFTLKLDLDKMQERLGDEYVIVLRTHYFIADSLDLKKYGSFAVNGTKHDDIAELYLISDILITDYSSVFFDYANLKRPMLFFTYDFEKYRSVLRGFYFDMEQELPGPLLYESDEVIEAIEHIDEIEAKYKKQYGVFYDKYCGWENGSATKQVVEEVFKKNKNKSKDKNKNTNKSKSEKNANKNKSEDKNKNKREKKSK